MGTTIHHRAATVRERAPWRRRGLLFGGAVIVMLCFLLAASTPHGGQPKATESQVQAAYLYNFARFVRWPDTATGPENSSFSICVFGQDPFGPILDGTVAGGIVNGKAVVAKRISTPQEGLSCQILFISSSEESRLGKVLGVVDKAAILTVSDMPQFSERGGMICFVREGNRVRFDVNLTATQNVGLTLSSELLKVAATVKRNRPVG